MRIIKVASLIGFLLVILVGCTKDVPTPEPELGVVNGVVLDSVANDQGIDFALQGLGNTKVELFRDGRVQQSTLTDPEGNYTFKDLEQGRYAVRATTANGKLAEGDTDVISDTSTTLNFLIVPSKEEGIFSSYAGLAVDLETSPSPDLNGDGIIDLDDYTRVTESAGLDPKTSPGDLNNDGVIDRLDVELILLNFGRVVLQIGTEYTTGVTPGETVATIGTAEALVQSETGTTVTTLERTSEPNIVRFTVMSDRGTVKSSHLGDFRYEEIPTNPSWVRVDLNTGRVVEGALNLRFLGEEFSEPFDVGGEIPDGLIALAPGGFGLYHFVGIEGTLPSEFPGLGGIAFLAVDCGKKKGTGTPGTPCTTAPPTGICVGGLQCAPGSTCTLSGGAGGPAGTCTTVRNPRTSLCTCQCL